MNQLSNFYIKYTDLNLIFPTEWCAIFTAEFTERFKNSVDKWGRRLVHFAAGTGQTGELIFCHGKNNNADACKIKPINLFKYLAN